jgi:type IV secretion system protein VirD4
VSSVAALSMASGPMSRKVAAALFGVVCMVGLACAAIYLSAALFLLLNKADPRQAHFGSITHYWSLYADDPRLRKSLVASMVVSGVGLLIVLPAALISAARPRRALHGNARFASAAEVERAGLTGNAGSTPSILVGRHGKQFLALPGQLSVMLSAPTRSGKGVGVVIPNLLNWPDSVVVLDIKGENFDVTAGTR